MTSHKHKQLFKEQGVKLFKKCISFERLVATHVGIFNAVDIVNLIE